jgi:hypothetical protein
LIASVGFQLGLALDDSAFVRVDETLFEVQLPASFSEPDQKIRHKIKYRIRKLAAGSGKAQLLRERIRNSGRLECPPKTRGTLTFRLPVVNKGG